MSLGKHLDDAAIRLEDAHRRVSRYREQQPSHEHLRSWLVALTDYAEALHDLQRYSDEAAVEQVQQLSKVVAQGNARAP